MEDELKKRSAELEAERESSAASARKQLRGGPFQMLPAWAAWLLPFVAVTAATGLRLALAPLVGPSIPYGLFFAAVTLTALLAGFGPGILAVCLAAASVSYFVLPPIGSFQIAETHAQFGVAVFAAIGVFVSFVGYWAQKALGLAEKAARQAQVAETRLRRFYDSNLIGVMYWNMSGRITEANEQFLRMVGYDRSDLAAGKLDWRRMTPDEYATLDQQCMMELQYTGGNKVPLEKEFVRKDGTRFAILQAAAMLDEARFDGVAFVLDITNQKKAEEALRRQAALIDLSPDAIITSTVGGFIKFWSRGAEKLYGWRKENAIGQNTHELLKTIFPQPLESILEQVRAGRDWTGELIHTGKDGRNVIVQSYWHAATIDTEVEILESNVDITERVRAEAALRDSEERYRGLFESSIDGIGITDMAGNILDANAAFQAMLGYSKDDLRNLSYLQITPSRWHDFETRILDEQVLRRGYSDEYEKEYIRKDGGIVPVSIRTWLLRDEAGQARGFWAIARDITERKQAEEARGESEVRFRALVTASSDVLYRMSPDWSEMMYLEGQGFLVDTEYSRPDWLQEYIHPDDQSFVLAAINESISKKSVFEMEHRVRRRDGSLGWTWSRAVPLIDGNGEIAEWFGAAKDITDRKRAEEELRAAQLSAERAKAEAERANAAKDQFLAVLSHELRTPLAPVLAGISLLRRKQCAECNLQNELEVIQRNIALEARLIDDLLDLTRIERGKISLERKPVYLCTVLERVADICRADMEARRLRFDLQIEDGPHRVNGDIARLQQIFWNLVNNAVKFTPDGGHINIRSRQENGRVIIDVSDSGIGIEPEAAKRIFSAFEQASSRVTQQFGGLGLGLAITKRLVELHDGDITVFSEGRGRGSTFTVILPLLRAKADTEADRTAPHVEPTSKRLLLVEDHADTAMMMKQLLEVLGYEVETAASVSQSLEVISEKQFDLLISDIGLPDKSGLHLMEELRERGSRLRGIALSGYGRDDDVRRSIESGFSAHLTKPVDLDVLITTVQELT